MNYRLTCKACSKEYILTDKTWAQKSKYCGRLCQNRQQAAIAGRKTTADALDRRWRLEIQQPQTYRLIPLAGGGYAKVDVQDYDLVASIPWRLSDNGYAICDRRPRRMHRLILQAKLGRELLTKEITDHKNRDRLDNRRSNLRLATISKNGANSEHKRGSSGYRGVIKRNWVHKTSYAARIQFEGKVYCIGTYSTALDAAYVHDQWALQLFGEFARCNVL